MINYKFGRLTVISKCPPHKDHRSRYICLCECGSTKIIQERLLRNGDTKSCGCLCNKSFHDISGSFICQIKSNAKIRNISYDLSNIDLWNKYLSQSKRCALSGLSIIFAQQMKNRRLKQTASLDRIDSSKSYTIDNIQWIHKDINIMKNSMSLQKFLEIVKLINNNKSKAENTSKTIQVYQHHKLFRGFGNLPMNLYKQYMRGAIARNIEFNITIEDCWKLFVQQNGKCHFTNLDIEIHTRRSKIETTASIDRINNSFGYTIDNIRWVHKDINKMKWDIDYESFLNYCYLICEHNRLS